MSTGVMLLVSIMIYLGILKGFILLTEDEKEETYKSQENLLELVVRFTWEQGAIISVFSKPKYSHLPFSITLRRIPRHIWVSLFAISVNLARWCSALLKLL
jgi:hypothetical protein